MGSICYVYNTSQYLYLHRFNLIKKMADSGYTVYAIAPLDSYSSKIKGKNIHYIELGIDRKGYNVFSDIKYIFRLFKIYYKLNPLIVHHFTIKPIIYGTLCARILKVSKILNSINGLGYLLVSNGFKSFLAKFVYKISIYAKNVLNIFQNSDDLNYFLSNKICYDKTAYVIEGCGIDLDMFKPSKKDQLWYDSNIKFLFLSRMLKDKGLIELVEAAKSLYNENVDFELILFGLPDNGNPESVTSKWLVEISEHPIINWCGFTEDSSKIIDSCHIMVLPSYREGLSQSLLEGIAMGKPIITSDVPGCRELINKNGLLVKPKCKNSIFKSMKKMLGDRKSLLIMTNRSIQLSKKYDVNLINEKITELYQ